MAAPPAPIPPPPPPKKKGGCLRRLGCGCLVVLLILAIIAGAGYYALRNNLLSQRKLANLTGNGTGEVQLTNVSDFEVTFSMTDSSGQGVPGAGDLVAGGHPVEPGLTDHFIQLKPGTYTVKFVVTAAGTEINGYTPMVSPEITLPTPSPGASPSPMPVIPACTLSIKSGDVFHFLAINDVQNQTIVLLVVRNQDKPATGSDMNEKTSSLCHA